MATLGFSFVGSLQQFDIRAPAVELDRAGAEAVAEYAGASRGLAMPLVS